MWTGQPPSCYWTWKMQGDWLRPSQRSEPVTKTDCEKPTQDAEADTACGLDNEGVTLNNRGEITWQEMILWDYLSHSHQQYWYFTFIWDNCLCWFNMKIWVSKEFSELDQFSLVRRILSLVQAAPGVLGNGPHEAYWWCWLWRRQNQYNKICYGAPALL
mgnify:FL=1